MPTYDYECQACGHAFELFQSMTAKVRRKCPQCGKQALRRLIGPGAGVLFKGDGFYTTDYRSDSYRARQKAAETPDKAEAKPDGAKAGEPKAGDATPAPKAGAAKGGEKVAPPSGEKPAKDKAGSGGKKKKHT